MQINVNIILAPDDPEFTQSPDEVASAILQALNGDVTKDTVACFIHRPSVQMGSAGTMPVPEPPPSTPVSEGEEVAPVPVSPVPPPPTQ